MHNSKLLIGLLLAATVWCSHTKAQPVTTPSPVSIACAQNSILPALANGQFGWAQCDPNGRLYSSPIGYTPIGAYITPLAVTTTSANTLLPSGTTVTVYNTGANPAYVKFGQSNAVVATTSNESIPPGGGCGFYVYPNTYIAAITASSTTTINVSGGTGGAMPCWGGTGSSGGGPTSNVTITSPLGTNAIGASVAVTPATSSVWNVGGYAQGSTTAGQTGPLTQAAVTSGSAGYASGNTSPLTLNSNGSLKVTIAPPTSTYIEASLTGATDTTICAGITPANGYEVINNSASEILYFRENGVAAVAGSTSVAIQVSAAYNTPIGYKPTGPVHVIATTTGHAVIERCY